MIISSCNGFHDSCTFLGTGTSRLRFPCKTLLTDSTFSGPLQLPRGLRHEMSSSAETLGSWVLMQFEACMSVRVPPVFALSCVGSGLATG
jgi:hypothetical protein